MIGWNQVIQIPHIRPTFLQKLLYRPKRFYISVWRRSPIAHWRFWIIDSFYEDQPKISDHFPKIVRRSFKLFRLNSEHFENCPRFPNTSKLRFSRKIRKCFDYIPNKFQAQTPSWSSISLYTEMSTDRFYGSGPHCKILTEKQPIRTLNFTSELLAI